MTDYHKDAEHEMTMVSGSSYDHRLKQAEIYAYMARTEVLKAANPEPVIKYKNVTSVYILEEQTGGGGWKTRLVFTDQRLASEALKSVEIATYSSNGYWEVRLKTYPVSTS